MIFDKVAHISLKAKNHSFVVKYVCLSFYIHILSNKGNLCVSDASRFSFKKRNMKKICIDTYKNRCERTQKTIKTNTEEKSTERNRKREEKKPIFYEYWMARVRFRARYTHTHIHICYCFLSEPRFFFRCVFVVWAICVFAVVVYVSFSMPHYRLLFNINNFFFLFVRGCCSLYIVIWWVYVRELKYAIRNCKK